MPILVECPGCGVKLNAPDSGAGKHVRCPKPGCGKLVPVPAPVPAESAPEPPRRDPVKAKPADEDDDKPRKKSRRDDDDEDEDDRPRRKRRRDEDDDDDDRPRGKKRRNDEDDEDDDRPRRKRRRDEDDDEDDRPRRGRRPRRKSGGGAGVVVAIVLGSLLLLGGVGYGIYAMLGGGKKTPPSGWKEFTYKDDNFKAYFPQEPTVHRDQGAFGLGSASQYTCGKASDPVQIEIEIMHFPTGLPAAIRDSATAKIESTASGARVPGLETKTVRWLGVKAMEVTTPGGVMRLAVTDKGMYQAAIRSGQGRAKADVEAAFFDNFELLK